MSEEISPAVRGLAMVLVWVAIAGVNLSDALAGDTFLLAPVEMVATAATTTVSALAGHLPVLLACAVVGLAGSLSYRAVSSLPNPYPTRAVGRFRRVVETETVIEECVNCGLGGVDGVERDARREVALAGRVVRVEESTVVSECRACHEADVVEYGLRASDDDPAPPDAADSWGEDDQQDSDDDLTRIMHVGDFVATNLRAAGFETFDDIRAADRHELTEVTGVGRQRAEDIQLGARHVGLEFGLDMAHRLDRAGFESAADIRAASLDDLTDVRGVGEVTARDIKHAVPIDDGEAAEVTA